VALRLKPGDNRSVPARQCHHCKQWIQPGEAHDCWTTTEAALTRNLAEDLRDAWERIRETAAAFGQQRIYASGHAIMFARRTCYLFVRPKKQYLEVCVFLGREIKSQQVQRIHRASKSKFVHILRVAHRDEVERPVTDWMREAYDVSNALSKKETAVKNDSKEPGPKKDNGAQIKRIRRICSSIPGTLEKISHGEPTFFTPRRVFAMFANNHHGDGHIAVWVPAAPGVQEALIEEAPDKYFRPPYVGSAGWVGVELSKVDDEQLGSLVREAYRLMTVKASPAKKTRKSKTAGKLG
jgi:hypothetical protein